MAEACTSGIDAGFVALGYAKVAVLGVVQGITELMPISSTAHMRIVPALLGWRDPGSAFSAAMQLAALAAVIACRVLQPFAATPPEPWHTHPKASSERPIWPVRASRLLVFHRA